MNDPLHHLLSPHGDHAPPPPARAETSRHNQTAQEPPPSLAEHSFAPRTRIRPGWTAGFTEDLERARTFTTSTPKLDLQIVDLRRLFTRDAPEALRLFDRCYDLYRRSFTDPNEVASETALLKALLRPTNPCHMLALVKGGEVIGVRHCSILKTECVELGTCAFDEYLYVDPSVRKGGIGKALLEKTDGILSSWGVRFTFAEINDPEVMTPELIRKDRESGISPQQRLRFWQKCGYEGIDAPYVQPPLADGLDPVYHLRIAVKQLTGSFTSSVPSASLANLLRSFHSTFVADVAQCSVANLLYAEIKRGQPERTPIIPLDTPRSNFGSWVPHTSRHNTLEGEEESFTKYTLGGDEESFSR